MRGRAARGGASSTGASSMCSPRAARSGRNGSPTTPIRGQIWDRALDWSEAAAAAAMKVYAYAEAVRLYQQALECLHVAPTERGVCSAAVSPAAAAGTGRLLCPAGPPDGVARARRKRRHWRSATTRSWRKSGWRRRARSTSRGSSPRRCPASNGSCRWRRRRATRPSWRARTTSSGGCSCCAGSTRAASPSSNAPSRRSQRSTRARRSSPPG